MVSSCFLNYYEKKNEHHDDKTEAYEYCRT